MKRKKLFENDFTVNGTTYFDYGTETVSANDLFDKTKTGMSFFDDLIKDPEYGKKAKNLKTEIKMLTPKEYFEECGKIFGNNAEKQIRQTKADTESINYLKKVILEAKKKFPITFLNYANNTQEGRHRMYVAAQLTSWDTKFPVLIIDYFDKELQKHIEEKRSQDRLNGLVKEGVRQSLLYKYTNLDDFVEEVEYKLSNIFDKDVKIEMKEIGKDIQIIAEGGNYTFSKDEIKIEPDRNVEEDEFDDISDKNFDIDKWLEKYL